MATIYPDYTADTLRCKEFLQNFEDGLEEERKYLNQIKKIAERQSKRLEISIDDLQMYEDSEEHKRFVNNVQGNVRRYIHLFAKAADEMMPASRMDEDQQQQQLPSQGDVIDVLIAQRLQSEREDGNTHPDPRKIFPPGLLRRYEVIIKPASKTKALPIRNIKAMHVGSLISVKGIVTRSTEVKPIITIATYTCDKCGCENYQEVLAKQFAPLVQCMSNKCKKNQSQGKLFLQTRGSKFEKYQELRIQEMADEVPIGNIPRSMVVHCMGETTRQAKPGDVVTISGIFLVSPFTGFRGVQAGLVTDPYLEAMNVTQLKQQYNDYVLTEEIAERINDLALDANLYHRLSQSIAPEIYGHEDVKKALLLLLVGGVTRVMNDGMKIRGDINICLMGDPGVAKSQLLKHITSISPRAVYTTGKGSSGVGLTAALIRDPVTDELVLEGGALVLADKGICCIDEFDKMEEGDRTAIHEVMEQQTISISKAGISTSLNARTSILAAANPVYGRYNVKLSAAQNINLPAALLSRFDLLFLLLDKPSIEDDLKLAAHVTYVHANNTHPPLDFEPLDANLMRHYISQAKQFEPVIPEELTNYIVDIYLGMRAQQVRKRNRNYSNKKADGAAYVSARSLLGILRLSQALSRLRFSKEVAKTDVDEAIRLIDMSKASLFVDERSHDSMEDVSSRIYRIIRDYYENTSRDVSKNPELNFAIIHERVIQKGFSESELLACLKEYEEYNVWIVGPDRTYLRFVQVH